jgi:hypothetical protein
MFRRSIFLGLMILLGAVLTYMILGSRKLEKQTAPRPTEIVRASKPSATRVLSPADLEVGLVRSTMAQSGAPGSGPAAPPPRHVLTIRNRGQVAYGRFMIRLSYADVDGREEIQSRILSELVPAGATVALPENVIEDLPRRMTNLRVQVAWADMVPTAAPR